MNPDCQMIVFSNKAYNAIIDETFKHDPIETGGILLGHVLDNGIWIVMEVLPPGINSIHQYAYFECDKTFVNYLGPSVASKYQTELNLLGLWHRHPGSMDVFSGTDDGTNLTFARLNPKGAISGLVNVDPTFRLTMRHVSAPLRYEIVDFEVGDDLIPDEYFKLKHFPEKGLHPTPTESKKALETVIEKNLDTESSPKEYKETEATKGCSSKILFPICILSILLSLLLAFEAYNKIIDNGRLVSNNKAVLLEKSLDIAAFQEAVAAYIYFANDTMKIDSVSLNVDSIKLKLAKQSLDVAAIQKAVAAYIYFINDTIRNNCASINLDSIRMMNAAINDSCKINILAKVPKESIDKAERKYMCDNCTTEIICKSQLIISILISLISLSALCYNFFIESRRRRNLPWYVKDSSWLLSDEYDLKKNSTTCERSIENEIVSFIVVTNNHYKDLEDTLAYQIVYPKNFDKERIIRIYLITPSFAEVIDRGEQLDLQPLKKDNSSELYYEFSIKSSKFSIKSSKGHAIEAVQSFYKWLGLNK